MRLQPLALSEIVISIYLYSIVALSVVTIISPLIVISLPLLLVLGPPAWSWWRHRSERPRMPPWAIVWLVFAASLLVLMPVGAATWWIVDASDGGGAEAALMVCLAFVLSPFLVAALVVNRNRSAMASDARVSRSESDRDDAIAGALKATEAPESD
jgi:hypothetical protein